MFYFEDMKVWVTVKESKCSNKSKTAKVQLKIDSLCNYKWMRKYYKTIMRKEVKLKDVRFSCICMCIFYASFNIIQESISALAETKNPWI